MRGDWGGFPPWQTVYWWFRRFVRLLLFRTIHDVVLMIDRERAGRTQPSAAILDSQSVKAPAAHAVLMGPRRSSGASAISPWIPMAVC
jgi:transposase